MAKALGIDYGTKRTGIAITDELQIIASCLTTVSTKQLDNFIAKLLNQHDIECFVIGDPKNLDGSSTNSSPYVEIFVRKLRDTYPEIVIHRVDERFTSKIAKQSIIKSGVNRKKRQDKKLVDKISATIILQSYLANK